MDYLKEPKQPSPKDWRFVKELSQPRNRYFNWTRRSINSDEADLSRGLRIKINFPDPEQRLKAAYEDLNSFFSDSGLGTKGEYEIIIRQIDTECFESYRIEIKPESCQIQAADTEGIRRGIYYLEDLLSGADGPFLKLGIIERKPWLKSRISRCFFGPIKRPPLYRDELLDDVDYYPDEYLNKLAHEGINGLWLTVEFKDICKTSITELASDAETRLAKLRRTVKKCLRYGIKIYIFCIEPCGLAPDDPILLKNPELKGVIAWNEKHCFCPSSETAQKYLYEATNWIFSQVPSLGGMINITHGERPTTCLSVEFGKNCPVCSPKTPGEIIAPALSAMEQGMHAAAPGAELISWFYVAQNGIESGCDEQMMDVAAKFPDNVILQYNFESGGSKEQLGKMRHAGDYWLSYVGPSNIFSQVSQKMFARGNKVSAKIQVGCSHELATVPFVPVPALLYQKYKSMHQLGVSHVMQCWYFGNCPGIMNKAAGQLAFEEFKDSEHDFLFRIAAPEWGEHSQKVVEAWELLAEGYSNYPLESMFQYYSPMHDGVVWPLYLIPEEKPLAPTWRLDYGTSGDRYGECLGKFSLDEVLTLCQTISEKWNKGAKIMRDLRPAFRDNPERLKDIDLVEALGVLFESGYNILNFYSLREVLLNSAPNEWSAALAQMENIVNGEIKRSSRMIKLCEADSRLGFHSEAEGYKFFPDKLKWRIEQLNNLLKKDFPVIKEKINSKQKPFADKITKSYICNSGKLEKGGDFTWRADYNGEKLKISVYDSSSSDKYNVFRIYLAPKAFYPPTIITFKGGEDVEILLCTEKNSVGFNIIRQNENNNDAVYTNDDNDNAWVKFLPLTLRLGLGHYNPQSMGKLILN
jgi:hypothetical protein